jgi:aldose 1-epimerase
MKLRTPKLVALLATVALVAACGPSAQEEPASEAADEAGAGAMNEQPTFSQSHYGDLEDGTPVTRVTLDNGHGVEVDVLSYGGIITRLVTPDAEGDAGNVVLALDSLEDYVSSSPYFGALIGRYGNRIAHGTFTLDGRTYHLATNDGENHLHGGVQGFDKKNWAMEPFTTPHSAGVVLTLVSPDGDQGYPGTLTTRATYELSDEDELEIRFHATTDKPTVVNLTAHSYFNLAGEGTVLDHLLTIPADTFTPVGPGLIPTGELRPVEGTPFDFRQPKAIGADVDAENRQLELGLGYDHNFVVKEQVDGDRESDELVLSARVEDPKSGRVLEVWSVEPGVQFYSGNFLDATLEGDGRVYEHRSGLCLEPQHFPDSPNHPDFPSTVLRPGETYESRIVYRFSTRE